jgi:N-acetylglucosaminyldiphosphoundecaprenol N-acetyl-beta-D-mannosaminyltransferase
MLGNSGFLPRAERRAFGFAVTMAGAADIAGQIATRRRSRDEGVGLVVTPNLDHIVQLRSDTALARAYSRAEVVACDGFPVRYHLRLRGVGADAATGCDIAASLMRMERVEPWQRLFFVVDSDATVDGVAAWAARRSLSDRVATAVPPVGFEGDADYCAALARRIEAHGTTTLMMGVGAPRSEVFVDTYRDALPPCWALCVGQAVKIEVGLRRRAPTLIRRLHGEWAWRIAQEPRRLARRYASGSAVFLLAAVEDMLEARLQRLAWRRAEGSGA